MNLRLILYLTALCLAVHALSAAEPVLKVFPEGEVARPGKPFEVLYEISWPVGSPDYALAVSEPDTGAWDRSEFGNMAGTLRDGENIVNVTLTLVAETSGTYVVPPMEISYFDRATIVEVGEKNARPPAFEADGTLSSEPLDIVVRPARVVMWSGSGVLLALAAALIAWYYSRTGRRRTSQIAEPSSSRDVARELLHSARQHRLDGAFYEYYSDLCSAVSILGPSAQLKVLERKLQHTAREIGYKGVRPTDDDMDGAMRDVERAATNPNSAVAWPAARR